MMTAARDWYSTDEVTEMTGATARQLQWWREHGWLKPKLRGHHLEWTPEQVEVVGKILALRKAGATHLEIRRLRLLKSDYKVIHILRKPTVVGEVLFIPRAARKP